MSDEQFIEQFTVTFIATWAANNHARACMTGDHKMLERPPIEDARHLAECALKFKKELDGEEENDTNS